MLFHVFIGTWMCTYMFEGYASIYVNEHKYVYSIFTPLHWCMLLCVCVCVHAHSLNMMPFASACYSLKTHGSLLSIILRIVQNPSELILINLEATTLGHEAVKCECLQMSAQGRQESRRTDQGLATGRCLPVQPSSRAPAQPREKLIVTANQ